MASLPSPFQNLPAERKQRWNLMKEVIDQWCAPLTEKDGIADPSSPIHLPIALREWYQLAGRRKDVWSHQDHFLEPTAINIKDEYAVFYAENQWSAVWGIRSDDLHRDDPPVYVKFEGQWIQ